MFRSIWDVVALVMIRSMKVLSKLILDAVHSIDPSPFCFLSAIPIFDEKTAWICHSSSQWLSYSCSFPPISNKIPSLHFITIPLFGHSCLSHLFYHQENNRLQPIPFLLNVEVANCIEEKALIVGNVLSHIAPLCSLKGPNHSLAGEISDSNVDGWELKFLDMYIHEINIYDIIINIYI